MRRRAWRDHETKDHDEWKQKRKERFEKKKDTPRVSFAERQTQEENDSNGADNETSQDSGIQVGGLACFDF